MLGTNTLGEIGLGEILAANDDVVPDVASPRGDDAPVRQRRRLRPEDIIAIIEAVNKEEAKPAPTKKKRKVLAGKIVDEVWEDTIFAPARKPVEQFVRQEVAQFYRPGVSWAEAHAAVASLIEAAQAEARRIQEEIEDEDEFLILMAA